MRNLKRTSIATWMKRANKLAIKAVGIKEYSVGLNLMTNASNSFPGEVWCSLTLSIHDHTLPDGESMVFYKSIADYLDERENRETFDGFKTLINEKLSKTV